MKKELMEAWRILVLKCQYFHYAVELEDELQDSEKTIKYWHDRYDLKNKDNEKLKEKILELKSELETTKEKNKTALVKLKKANAILESEQKENKKKIKELTSRIKQWENKGIQKDELRLWSTGQKQALKKLRERKKKASATHE